MGDFGSSLELEPIISQTQPAHLKQAVGIFSDSCIFVNDSCRRNIVN